MWGEGRKLEKIPKFFSSENKKKLEFEKFIPQIRLPEEKWSEEFRRYIRKKSTEKKTEISEHSLEEKQRLTFERYLKGLGLKLEDLRGKSILDLGCGEGSFVKECLDKGITNKIYGLDLRINPKIFGKKYENHFFQGNFEQEFPVGNLDLIISLAGVEAPTNEEDKRNIERALRQALNAIKKDGEIRIYPLRKAPPGSGLKGIEFARRKWEEVLEILSSEIDYKLIPIDIKVSGKKPDVWLEEVLIIRRKEKLWQNR